MDSTPGGSLRQRIGPLTLGLLVGAAPVARAQLEPIGVPPGLVRLQAGGELDNYNHRYLDGVQQSYAADFIRDAVGSSFWPELASADTTVGAILGQASYRINLGRSSSTAEVNVGTFNLGVGLGVTRFLSLFGNVPIVRVRVQPRFTVDSSTADAGFNPADPTFGSGAGLTTTFFNQFDGALAALSTNLANGTYDADPAQKALAQATLASGTALRTHLDNLLINPATASPFVPTASSAAGAAMTDTVASLQTVLSGSLGVGGFTQPLTLPTQRLSQQDIDNFITNPAGPVAGAPISEVSYTRLGDIQLGAVFTPVDRWDRGNHQGGLRTAITGSITLPTGATDLPGNFFDLGTGTGHYQVGLVATADVGVGRIGARLTAGYDWWLPRFRVRRVSPPDQPIPYAYRLANLDLNPGDVLTLGARPFFRLARTLALQAGVDYWHRAADQVSYQSPADSIPGIPASELVQNSQASATVVSGGISFSSGFNRRVPIEAQWTYEAVVAATGGRVPQGRNMRVALRLYYPVWGK